MFAPLTLHSFYVFRILDGLMRVCCPGLIILELEVSAVLQHTSIVQDVAHHLQKTQGVPWNCVLALAYDKDQV